MFAEAVPREEDVGEQEEGEEGEEDEENEYEDHERGRMTKGERTRRKNGRTGSRMALRARKGICVI